jgi:hypothetical protein
MCLTTRDPLQIDLEAVREKDERDALMLARLEDWDPLRAELVTFLRLVCRYGADPRLTEALPAFFESALALTQGARLQQWHQHLKYIIHEGFLYTVTVLMQEQQFDGVALLLSSYYRDPKRTETTQRYGIFSYGDTEYLGNLLNGLWSKQENIRGYRYPHQTWIYKRVSQTLVPFELLKEADIILWLRYKFEQPLDTTYRFLSWTPVTVGSLQDYEWQVDAFPIFQRAASRRFFDRFKTVLGVESKDEVLQRWGRAFPKKSEQLYDDYWERIFNVVRLAST